MNIPQGIQAELTANGWTVDSEYGDGYVYIIHDHYVIGSSQYGIVSAMIDARKQQGL